MLCWSWKLSLYRSLSGSLVASFSCLFLNLMSVSEFFNPIFLQEQKRGDSYANPGEARVICDLVLWLAARAAHQPAGQGLPRPPTRESVSSSAASSSLSSTPLPLIPHGEWESHSAAEPSAESDRPARPVSIGVICLYKAQAWAIQNLITEVKVRRALDSRSGWSTFLIAVFSSRLDHYLSFY